MLHVCWKAKQNNPLAIFSYDEVVGRSGLEHVIFITTFIRPEINYALLVFIVEISSLCRLFFRQLTFKSVEMYRCPTPSVSWVQMVIVHHAPSRSRSCLAT